MSKFRLLVVLVVVLFTFRSVAIVVAQTPTELTYWTFVDGFAEYWQSQAERWNEANPDRPITLVPSVIPWDDMHRNLLASLLVGSGAPDIVDVEINRFATFVKGDIHLVDITDAVEPFRDQLIETRLAPWQWQGKQYGVDYHLGAYMMFYNREIMETAGVDPDSIQTWDDYIEAGKKVTRDTDGDGNIDVWMAPLETGSEHVARGIYLMMGGGIYNEAGDFILNSPENAAAFQFMDDLIHVDGIAAVAPGTHVHAPEFFQAMAQGMFGSIWMPQWYWTRFRDNMEGMEGKMIARPMPIFEEGGYTSAMGGGTTTVPTDQIPDDELQLAKDFIAFGKLTYEAGVQIATVIGLDPIRPDVYDAPELQEPNEFMSGENMFAIEKTELGNVAPEYTGPLFPEARDSIATQVTSDVFENGVDPADALAAAEAQVLASAG
jgi:arabinosaccharide transport system substrate-binding protein